MNAAILEKLLHDSAFQQITDQNQGTIIRKGAFGFQIIEEFLETAFFSLRETVHFVKKDHASVGRGRMNPFTDAGFNEKRKDRLAKGGAGSGMAGVEFLYPEMALFAYAIDHGGFADARRTDEQKCRMRSCF